MKPRIVRLLLMLTALVLLGESQVRADPIDYSYQWSVLPSPVVTGGTGSVQITPPINGTGEYPTSSFIPGPTATTTSSATNPPDSFSSGFSLDLKLTDTASGKSGDVIFDGMVSGTLTANSASLSANFSSPQTKMITLGSHVYTVTIEPTSVTLPAPGEGKATMDAQVTVANSTGGGNPGGNPGGGTSNTPEPSTLILGATAALGLALRRLTRARRSRI